MSKLETALIEAAKAVRAAQEEITNQESTYVQLDEMIGILNEMIEDKVWE